jgi:hypothetical protein
MEAEEPECVCGNSKSVPLKSAYGAVAVVTSLAGFPPPSRSNSNLRNKAAGQKPTPPHLVN